jgi:hypothetical protein
MERCNPTIFSGATDRTRPSHHKCPPDPAWEQEDAADRLRAAYGLRMWVTGRCAP